MERLTEEVQIGPFAALKDKAEAVPGAFGTYDCFYAHEVAVTRLKQYEDTGLEPEEIRELCDRLEQLRRGDKRPPCYLEERTNSAYPLCVGRGFKNCAHCGFWRDLDEEQDESRVGMPLTLEELREMDGEPVWDNLLKTWGLVVGDRILYRNGEKLRICGNGYRRKPEEVEE